MFTNQNQEECFSFFLSEISKKRQGPLTVTGVNDTFSAYLTNKLYQVSNKSIIVVVSTPDEAQRYLEELIFFQNGENSNSIIYFPSYDVFPFKRGSYHNDIASKRIACLYRLLENKSRFIVVTDLCGLRQKLIPKKILMRYVDLIQVEEEIDTESLVDKFVCGGYNRTVIVEEPGDFSVRGGIVDFFPPMYPNPVRVELFGDFIESIRFFSPVDQRSLNSIDEVILLPAREAVFEKNKLKSIVANIRSMAVKQRLPKTYIREITDNIRNKDVLSSMDKLTPLLYNNNMDSLIDYVPDTTIFITIDRSNLLAKNVVFQNKLHQNFEDALESDYLCLPPDELFFNYELIEHMMLSKKIIDYKILQVVKGVRSGEDYYIDVNCSYNNDLALLVEKAKNTDNPLKPLIDVLMENKSKGYSTVFACGTKNKVDRLNSLLSLNGVKTTSAINFFNTKNCSPKVYVCLGTIRAGFIFHETSLAVMTYEEIFGIKSVRRKFLGEKKKVEIFDIENLKIGDFIVHTDHGIGKYNGLTKLNVDGVTSDFLLIMYRNDDKLYLPVDHMGLVQKYMAVEEGYIPILDKMGGKSWVRLKDKIRSSAERIAGGLLEVYAKRKIQVGYSFSYEEKLMNEFESNFIYEETSDQLKAISEVLYDMKKSVPMDRLICGDVGYGKTEIALRAAFVAVSEVKQVAILVPTTVLAEQHFCTFSDRFKKYPIKIACLSRFKSKREQKFLIEGIKSGDVDIIVGTHRLLQEDISFKDLGLVVLDEEQRFGVEHKERLKKIRTSVDVLALTATPIPRTLHLSLMGVRDISVISTPPDHRRSIITYVCEFDYAVVGAAVRNELDRKGQIFFIHNNISTIHMIARRLKLQVPEVRLEVAHGQMNEESLESVMMDFVDGKIDMLVCTTIIESGIDVARANTIMVNRADKFGLAQIYQIRGRVGRSDQQAYAYLFIPDEGLLSDKARKRLKVLMEHSDLGAGFQIAMNDMKIRGGGTILGASQSGHVARVGYDMFLRLMEESIAQLKGEPLEEILEPEINLSISAFISDKYISDIDQRLSVYRRLAKINQLKDVSMIKEELLDRFGLMPKETSNLLLKVILKILARHAGVKQIDIFDQVLILSFSEKHQENPSGIINLVAKCDDRYKITADGVLTSKLLKDTPTGYLFQVQKILLEVKRHVSNPIIS